MAGWNDLPPEIKQVVVNLVDEQEYVLVKTKRDALTRQRLRSLSALSGMDRELHALCAPLMWQTVDLDRRRFSRCESFIADVRPSTATLVQHLQLEPLEREVTELTVVVDAYADLLRMLSALETLTFRCTSAVTIALLPLLPPTLSTSLRSIEMVGDYSLGQSFSYVAVAALLSALPELETVELAYFNSDGEGAVFLLDTIRRLSKLQDLSLLEMGAGLLHSALAHPWNSSLVSLSLGHNDLWTIGDDSTIHRLLQSHAQTLESLDLPECYSPQLDMPPLPRLLRLSFWLTEDAIALPTAFSASPLQQLHVSVNEYTSARWMKGVKETIVQHGDTLEEVLGSDHSDFDSHGGGARKALRELEDFCDEEGYAYEEL